MENSNKRSRGEFADSSPDEGSKRLRPDLLIEILDDDEEEVDSGVECLADVMKSLEDEISLPSLPAPSAAPERSPQHDLGYLLEASDDELGLPPTVGSETPASDAGDDVVVVVGDKDTDLAGFGRIWGFEDEISGGYGGYFGFGEPVDIGFGDGFEGAYSADYSVYEELLWRGHEDE